MDHTSPTESRSSSPPSPANDAGAGRSLWLEAGARQLAERGPDGLRLHELADRVGRTTGSFYHHFSGMAAFREALAESFSGSALLDAQAAAANDDPRRELEQFLRIHQSRQIDELASAMRAWGRSFPPAGEAVARAERALMLYLEQIFRRLGSPRTTARAQARLLVSLGAGEISSPWKLSAAERRRALDIVLDFSQR